MLCTMFFCSRKEGAYSRSLSSCSAAGLQQLLPSKGEGKESKGTKTNTQTPAQSNKQERLKSPKMTKGEQFSHPLFPLAFVLFYCCALRLLHLLFKVSQQDLSTFLKGHLSSCTRLITQHFNWLNFLLYQGFPIIFLAFGLFGILRIKKQSEQFERWLNKSGFGESQKKCFWATHSLPLSPKCTSWCSS